MKESLKYQTMLEEVEGIVKEMSSPDLDLDQMVNKVERGYELIQLMRDRLQQTKAKVEDLHAKYDGSE
ncbi:exodeoxyribonuclease VII small subunit [Pseudobacteriovorax antillogorgiicola]|uniref:Exodeoxyribonuclease VII small subunit n=1 Tax=Pseudobacteriovorax antillogorgiicola TaxID=1513793 RepID=A0A1Y6BV38_9BACT|nr:exodeoxyribonuclease VII small subunit [Pseudobacteriovorax antillogorgiicola]TCS53831.1 exodeoxyribonuclease VII small subunit [Pseudobacteriovorax antillogorgiicola]SMF21756.1 Exodeoxyribonuclease VII small subunit [Pseudobacteriovorax antillogorgiicola]